MPKKFFSLKDTFRIEGTSFEYKKTHGDIRFRIAGHFRRIGCLITAVGALGYAKAHKHVSMLAD